MFYWMTHCCIIFREVIHKLINIFCGIRISVKRPPMRNHPHYIGIQICRNDSYPLPGCHKSSYFTELIIY